MFLKNAINELLTDTERCYLHYLESKLFLAEYRCVESEIKCALPKIMRLNFKPTTICVFIYSYLALSYPVLQTYVYIKNFHELKLIKNLHIKIYCFIIGAQGSFLKKLLNCNVFPNCSTQGSLFRKIHSETLCETVFSQTIYVAYVASLNVRYKFISCLK